MEGGSQNIDIERGLLKKEGGGFDKLQIKGRVWKESGGSVFESGVDTRCTLCLYHNGRRK